MHLYLSSFRFGSEAESLRALTGNKTAVVIANALDYSDDLARKAAGTAREIKELEALGFAATEVDLRDFFRSTQTLAERLAEVGLIWAVGGNAFLLRRAFKQSGLDDYLLDRRGDDSFVYGGYSAGACVVTPTLAGIHLVDPPGVVAVGYDPQVVWAGVGLVPFSIAPHYRSAHPNSAPMEDVVQYFVDRKIEFRALVDGDVVITSA